MQASIDISDYFKRRLVLGDKNTVLPESVSL
jgi:hypothetical protein